MNNFEKWKAELTVENFKIGGIQNCGLDCCICPVEPPCSSDGNCLAAFRDWALQEDASAEPKQDCVESFSKWGSQYQEYIGNQSGYDQSVKYDGNKRRVEFLPDLSVLLDIAEVFEAGERKGYARDSWQNVEYERYRASFLRHIIAWWREEHSVDEETGLPHFQLMLCNAYMLWWLRRNTANE